jgi:hypothetical protein
MDAYEFIYSVPALAILLKLNLYAANFPFAEKKNDDDDERACAVYPVLLTILHRLFAFSLLFGAVAEVK